MKLLVLIVKVLGVILAGLFGYIGTIHEFRNSKGQITKWGKLALYGIPISIFLTVVTLVYDETSNLNDQKKLDDNLNDIALNVLRGQSLIENINLEFNQISLPVEDEPELLSYQYTIDSVFYSMPYDVYEYEGILRYPRMLKDGYLVHNGGLVTPESDLHPSRFYEYLFGAILNVFIVDIQIFKKSISVEQFIPHVQSGQNPKPDIHIFKLANPDYTNEKFEALKVVRHFYGPDSLSLSGSFDITKDDWISKTGEITSTLDLEGAQIFFSLGPPKLVPEGSEESQKFIEVRNKFEVPSVTLHVNDLEFNIDSTDLRKIVYDDSSPYWVTKINFEKMLLSN